jgi:hypothetical protein
MGNAQQALSLLLTHIGSVKRAITFVESQDRDSKRELWDDLIQYSLGNEHFMAGLLEHAGELATELNLAKLVDQIPPRMQLEGLKEKLVKINHDHSLQLALRKGCNAVFAHDCLGLQRRLNQGQRRAVRVEPTVLCGMPGCGKPICANAGEATSRASVSGIDSGSSAVTAGDGAGARGSVVDGAHSQGVYVFGCHHVYHEACLRACLDRDREDLERKGNDVRRMFCIACQSHKPKKIWRNNGSMSR